MASGGQWLGIGWAPWRGGGAFQCIPAPPPAARPHRPRPWGRCVPAAAGSSWAGPCPPGTPAGPWGPGRAAAWPRTARACTAARGTRRSRPRRRGGRAGPRTPVRPWGPSAAGCRPRRASPSGGRRSHRSPRGTGPEEPDRRRRGGTAEQSSPEERHSAPHRTGRSCAWAFASVATPNRHPSDVHVEAQHCPSGAGAVLAQGGP